MQIRLFLSAVLTFCLVGTMALAQQETPAEQPEQKPETQLVPQSEHSPNVWLEFGINRGKSSTFGDAIENSSITTKGKSYTFGWEPFRNSEGGTWIKDLMKYMGFTFNLTDNDLPSEAVFLGNIYTEVPLLKQSTVCGGQYGLGKRCVACGYENLVGKTCTYEEIYAFPQTVKYMERSIALGMYVPIDKLTRWIPYIGKNLDVQTGVNVRRFHLREGVQTNLVEKSSETVASATLRIFYPILGGLGASFSAERSFWGSKSGNQAFKYRRYDFNIVYVLR